MTPRPQATALRRPFMVGRVFALRCRGRMHAARGRSPYVPFLRCDRVWSMRRGGIHAARRTLCRWPLPVCMVFALHCRAGVHARRTDDFLKFYNVRRGQDPALQSGGNGRVSHKPRVVTHPCRAACMPPLQTPGIASMIPGTGGGGRFTGRMHAAPTNLPEMAGEWERRHRL